MELLPDLSSEENSVFRQLSYEPIHIDELCIQMNEDTPKVLSTLSFAGIKKAGSAASREIIYQICLINCFYVICLILRLYIKNVISQP